MRFIIAGSRDFADFDLLKKTLDQLKTPQMEVVSGTARGADQLGERWARENGVPVRRFPAQWDTYGKSAGYRRNEEMARNADVLVAFWDGQSRGTGHMIDIANRMGLRVHIIRY